MQLFRTLGAYTIWHYSRGIKELMELWGNLLIFCNHFFSLPILLRTLFSRWRRLGESDRRAGLHPGKFFGDAIVNTLMRLVGFCVRFPTLIVGFFALVVIALAFPAALLLWLLLPVVALLLIASGLGIMIFGL